MSEPALTHARIRVRTAGVRIVLNSMKHDPRAAGMIANITHALADLDAIDRLVADGSDKTPVLPTPVVPKDSTCLPR